MIISHKYNFIFLKTYKTAGTSIEVYLSKYCGSEDILTPIHPHVHPHRPRNYKSFWNILPEVMEFAKEGRRVRNYLGLIRRFIKREKFRPHMEGSLVKQRVPESVWSNYFKFCVERNPWDKTASHYYMLKGRLDGDLTLDEYFERGDFCLNHPIYMNGEDIIVDHIIGYENLNKELGDIFESMNIPYNGELGVHAKSGFREVESYKDIFNDEQIDIIKNVFEKEIGVHGYEY